MRSLLLIAIVAALGVAGPTHAQNLLVNPSFEDPDVEPGGAEIFIDGITGWTESTFCGIEVQDNCCGAPFHGDQHVELNSTCSSAINQTVATTPGAKYVLTFHFSPRPGLMNNRLIVRWNGVQIFDETRDSIGPGLPETDWTFHAIVVTATGATSTVEFADGSPGPAGVGTYIDALPEPGRSAQFTAGLSLLAGLDRLRRRRSRSRPRGRSR